MKKNIIHERISIKSDEVSGPLLNTLAIEVLRAKNVISAPGLKIHQLENGTVIELYGTGAVYPEHIFDRNEVVLRFRVADLETAVHRLVELGAQLLDDIMRPCSTYAYCHLQVGSDITIGLYQET